MTQEQTDRRRLGLCFWCGCWAEGFVYCSEHREYFRNLQRKIHNFSRTYKIRDSKRSTSK